MDRGSNWKNTGPDKGSNWKKLVPTGVQIGNNLGQYRGSSYKNTGICSF